MNIEELHHPDKEVSAVNFFNGETGRAVAIQLKLGSTLAEHISTKPALLICVKGAVIFKDEQGRKIEMESGDYVNIEPGIKHSVYASLSSQLVVLK